MTEPDFCVGLDVGTGSLKGLAVGLDGEPRAEASVDYPLTALAGGGREQDPELWWEACEEVLRRLGAERAAGIGLSGQMHGLVLLDERQRVLRPALLWNDTRAAAEAEELERRVGGAEAAVAFAGSRPMPGLTAPKLLWVRRHEPELFARARHLLLPKDEVRRRLCGELAIDAGDASGTWLLDVGRRAWSERLCEAAEADPALLPPVGEAPDRAGVTSAGVPVALGSGDQPCGALGVGATREGVVSLVLGTSGVALAPLAGFGEGAAGDGRVSAPGVADADAWTHSYCHALPGRWYRMGVSLSAGGGLEWLRATVAPEESATALLAAAGEWAPGAGGLNFLPYLNGERTPIGNPAARASFVGLGLEHDRGALVRAVLEGVAYALADCFEAAVAAGPPVREVRVSGGGARSELWLRILASVLRRPLEVAAHPAGAAHGAALLGGLAAGAWPTIEAAPPAWRRTRTVEPDPAWLDAYAEGAARQRTLRDQLARP